jgi:histidinol-phosphate aminotransferase
MSRIGALLRPHIADVPPYVTARSSHLGGILLDANENAFGSPVGSELSRLHRYPDPSNAALREALAARLASDPSRLWVGNGSDDAIDLLVRVIVDPGAPVAVPAPSYGVYAQRVAAHAGEVRRFLLDADFDLDVEAAAKASRGAKLCILCSPNNPTGNLLSGGRVIELLDRIEGILAVDEAYLEFAGEEYSLVRQAGDEGSFERLVVIRTLSKAWGLAGARVGYLAGAPALIAALERVGLPYPLSTPAAAAAIEALSRSELVADRVSAIRRERDFLAAGLANLGLRTLPSVANFLCFFVEDPRGVQSALAEDSGVIIRDRSTMPGLAGALRVTVGTRPENEAFLEGLRRELAG